MPSVTVRALLFDFDGVLWNSEAAGYQAWHETFASFGEEFPLEVFAAYVGSLDSPDPMDELERRLGRVVDRDAAQVRRRARLTELIDALQPLPGVEDYLREAKDRGLATAIVSTNHVDWISEGLARMGIDDGWRFVESADGDHERAKPLPTLYLAALERLSLRPHEAVAIEDSPNGIRAAKDAGLFCLAVPTEVTRGMDLAAADLVVASLADLPLAALLRIAEDRAADHPSQGNGVGDRR
jgi:HAD superfamily hydrolase (TIGR01509 family)